MTREAAVLLEGLVSSLCEDSTVFEKHTESLGASVWLTWLLASFTRLSSSFSAPPSGDVSER